VDKVPSIKVLAASRRSSTWLGVMETPRYPYRRQSPYLGAILLLVSKKAFLEMAVNHGMAINLESPDQRRHAEARGGELIAEWENSYRSGYSEMVAEIRGALWGSFAAIAFLSLTAIAIGLFNGSVSASLSYDLPKALTFVGTALVAWATLMELGGSFMVWDGPAYPQIAHKVLFKSIFLPGIALLLVGLVQ